MVYQLSSIRSNYLQKKKEYKFVQHCNNENKDIKYILNYIRDELRFFS